MDARQFNSTNVLVYSQVTEMENLSLQYTYILNCAQTANVNNVSQAMSSWILTISPLKFEMVLQYPEPTYHLYR